MANSTPARTALIWPNSVQTLRQSRISRPYRSAGSMFW